MRKALRKIDGGFKELNREFALLIGLIAVAGSLAASKIFGWETFTLSTLQRVFMYPLVPVISLAIVFDIKDLRKLVLALTTLGMMTSAFHFIIVLFDPTRGCGFALPCSAGLRYTIAGLSIRPITSHWQH